MKDDFMDFDPILPDDEDFENKLKELAETNTSINTIENSSLIKNNKDSLTILNLVNVASTHIDDMEECRKENKEVSNRLKIHRDMLSLKELLEYKKILVREIEVYAKSLRDIYNIAMKTELAKQILLGNSKDERTIRNISPKVNGLLGILQKTIDVK